MPDSSACSADANATRSASLNLSSRRLLRRALNRAPSNNAIRPSEEPVTVPTKLALLGGSVPSHFQNSTHISRSRLSQVGVHYTAPWQHIRIRVRARVRSPTAL